MSQQDWSSVFAEKVTNALKPKKIYVCYIRPYNSPKQVYYSFDEKEMDERELAFRQNSMHIHNPKLVTNDLHTLRKNCMMFRFDDYIDRFVIDLNLLEPS